MSHHLLSRCLPFAERRGLFERGYTSRDLLVSRLQWKLHANRDDLEALISIGQIAQYSDEAAAQAAISRALELAPGDRAVVKLGLRAFSEHDLARAVAIAHQYGVAHPDDPRMYVELGRCAARRKHTSGDAHDRRC